MGKLLLAILFALSYSAFASAAEPYGFAGVGAARYDLAGTTEAWRPQLDNDTAFAWQLGAGLQLNPHFAFEISWLDLGKITGRGDGAVFVDDGKHQCCVVGQTGSSTARFAGVTAGVVLAAPAGTLTPHLKLGAFFNSDAHDIEFVRTDGVSYSTSHHNSASPLLGLGVTISAGLTLDYTWLRETNAWGAQDITVQALTLGYRWQ